MKKLLLIILLVFILVFTVNSSRNKWTIEVINNAEAVDIGFKELKEEEILDLQLQDSDYVIKHILKGKFAPIKKNVTRRYETGDFAQGYMVLVRNKRSEVSLKFAAKGMLYPRKVTYFIGQSGLSDAILSE